MEDIRWRLTQFAIFSHPSSVFRVHVNGEVGHAIPLLLDPWG